MRDLILRAKTLFNNLKSLLDELIGTFKLKLVKELRKGNLSKDSIQMPLLI